MHKKALFFFYLFIVITVANSNELSLIYPDDFVIYDNDKNFNLILGGIHDFLERAYGSPLNSEILYENEKPFYQFVNEEYRGFTIVFSTDIRRIDQIDIISENMVTSRGIAIGSTVGNVLQEYGSPITGYNSLFPDKNLMVYSNYYPEINFQGEMTYLVFEIIQNKVSGISIYIASTV